MGPWAGALSQLGILFWSVTATICLFSFMVLRKKKVKKNRSFLLFSALLSFFLLFDDLFLLHDSVFPYMGISEKVVLMVYPLSVLYMLLFFRKEILSSSFLILLSALGFLALSVLVDVTDLIFQDKVNLLFLVEDGLKFMGIIGWFIYFSDTSFATLKKAFKAKKVFMVGKTIKIKEEMELQTLSA